MRRSFWRKCAGPLLVAAALCGATGAAQAAQGWYEDFERAEAEAAPVDAYAEELVRQAADLAPASPAARELVVLTAARLGKARLIDNVQVSR